MSPVRVLVVDDSLTMRGLISAALKSDPEIEVVGTAVAMGGADPELQARADLVTMGVLDDGVHGALLRLGLI